MRLSVLSVAYPLAPVGPDAAGGAEQILAQLDSKLVRNGHHSVVIASEGSAVEGALLSIPRAGDGELSEEFQALARQRVREAIGRALSRWDFDLIHMHGVDFHHYLPPPGVPVLATLHLPPEWYPEWVFRAERPHTWLHGVSQSQQDRCPPSGLLLPYIANGVPVARFETCVRKRCFAVALGRICPEKGYHVALDAASRAGVPLILAGELFRYRSHEEYFAREIVPRIGRDGHRFIGAVGMERKRRLLSAARCLVVPSLAPETSSLVAMEALACGTPVVAFPAGALAEIVEHGRTGFLVNDEPEMAQAIRAAGSIDPEECRSVARRRFDAGRMLEQYLQRYARLARAAARGVEVSGHA